jgi:hypothetical protein
MAASALPSRLVTRSSSIPHLVLGWAAALPRWRHEPGRMGVQPQPRGIATLATKRPLAPMARARVASKAGPPCLASFAGLAHGQARTAVWRQMPRRVLRRRPPTGAGPTRRRLVRGPLRRSWTKACPAITAPVAVSEALRTLDGAAWRPSIPTICINVDWPEPFSPTRPMSSPAVTCRLVSFRARCDRRRRAATGRTLGPRSYRPPWPPPQQHRPHMPSGYLRGACGPLLTG